jgi:predicted small secreted protein
MKKNCMMALMFLAFIGTAACSNTMHGAGKDVENAGETMQQNAAPRR